MILKANINKLTVVSEDPMDVEFLESLFEDSIQIKKESDFIRHGFHETNERSVSVTFVKSVLRNSQDAT